LPVASADVIRSVLVECPSVEYAVPGKNATLADAPMFAFHSVSQKTAGTATIRTSRSSIAFSQRGVSSCHATSTARREK